MVIVLIEHERKELSGINDDLLERIQYLLGGQLHDLTTQINDPYNLLMLIENLL